MANDNIQIEILDDGTIKVTTDQVSGPNHANAEAFLKMLAQLGGGETIRIRRSDVHTHSHTYSGQQHSH